MAKKKFYIVKKYVGNGRELYNFISSRNEILSGEWFDFANEFDGDFAMVKRNEKWNFINRKGEVMLSEWHGDVIKCDGNLAAVIGYGEECCRQMLIDISTDKRLGEGDGVYDGIYTHDMLPTRRFVRVSKDGGIYYIDKKSGKHLAGRRFVEACPFFEGMAKVLLKTKGEEQYHYINEEGVVVTEGSDGYSCVSESFQGGFAAVERNGLWNFIRKDGTLLLSSDAALVDNNFIISNVSPFMDCATKKFAFVNRDGEIVLGWFDSVDAANGWVFVNREDGHSNVVDADGRLVCDEWFDYDEHEAYSSSNTITARCVDGVTRLISRDSDGNYTVKVSE